MHSQEQENQILAQDLRQFGLDPRDWKLIRENSGHYRIESVKERNFVFTGQVRKQGDELRWQELSLSEI